MIVETKLLSNGEILPDVPHLPDMSRLYWNLPPAKEGDYLPEVSNRRK